MNQDLISRQAILKHIEKKRQDALMIDDLRESNIIMMGMKLLEEAVRNQPSAQSEHLVKESGNLVKGLVNDCISRQAAIESVNGMPDCPNGFSGTYDKAAIIAILEDVPSVHPDFDAYCDRLWKLAYERGKRDAQPRWIPIKWHDCTAEEREEYGFGEEIATVFDCDMPSDNQEILVTTSHGYVEKDVCYIDDGFSLDSCYDWIEDITAWMPLPESYKEGQDE